MPTLALLLVLAAAGAAAGQILDDARPARQFRTIAAPPPDHPPGDEYDDLLTLSGWQPGPVATETTTWSAIHVLYR